MGRETEPNDLFRAARERLASPSGAPRPMSRRELADMVNTYLWREHKVAESLNQDHIGNIERGRTRWPNAWRRLGLRAVLGATSDAQLGLWFYRDTSTASSSADDADTTGHRGRAADISDSRHLDELTRQLVQATGLDHVCADDSVEPVLTPTLGTPRRALLIGIAAVAASCGLLGNESKGRRLGVGDVERINAVAALYRSVDYEYGGGVLYIDVSRFAESTSELLDQTYPQALAPRLLAAVAAARQLAGWTAFDSCRHADAQRHFLAAERVAVAADDPLLAARVRYCQARQYQHLRHNRDALDTLWLARDHLGGRSTAAVATMLDGAQAASLAALGDGKQALALLERAEAGFGEIDIEREPDWMHFYDRGELLAQYGRVYRDLARANRRYGSDAVTFTTDAIGAFNPQNARSNVLNQVGLCSALVLAGEPGQAVAVGSRAIEQAQGLASPRIFDRLHNVRHDLAGHQKVPAVAELAHTLATLRPGTGI